MRLTKNDFDGWWNLPVGIEFRRMIKEDMDKLAHGNMHDSFTRDTIGNALEVGKYKALLFIHNLTHENVVGDE